MLSRMERTPPRSSYSTLNSCTKEALKLITTRNSHHQFILFHINRRQHPFGCARHLALKQLAQIVYVQKKRARLKLTIEIDVAPSGSVGRKRQTQGPKMA